METPDTNSEREIIAAAAVSPEERAAYLATTCEGQPTLRGQAADDELRVHPEQAGENFGIMPGGAFPNG
ncbi:MAG: hypothetical protein V4819_25820 [Verrucomicrobiota bacterium]